MTRNLSVSVDAGDGPLGHSLWSALGDQVASSLYPECRPCRFSPFGRCVCSLVDGIYLPLLSFNLMIHAESSGILEPCFPLGHFKHTSREEKFFFCLKVCILSSYWPPLLCVEEGEFQGPRKQRDPQKPDPEMPLLPGVPIARV